MKNKTLLIILLILNMNFLSCDNSQNKNSNKEENQVGIIKGDDFRSKAMMRFTDAYVNNNLESTSDIFLPSVKIMVNDSDVSFDEMVSGFSSGHEYFDNIRHENRGAYTMHYTEGNIAGNIFTHYWYTWKATSRKTGEEISIRGYAWMKWKNDKVEAMYNAFDPTLYNASMQ